MSEEKQMTREEWALKLIRDLASGHMNGPIRAEAARYLQGDPPPVKWYPKEKPKK